MSSTKRSTARKAGSARTTKKSGTKKKTSRKKKTTAKKARRAGASGPPAGAGSKRATKKKVSPRTSAARTVPGTTSDPGSNAGDAPARAPKWFGASSPGTDEAGSSRPADDRRLAGPDGLTPTTSPAAVHFATCVDGLRKLGRTVAEHVQRLRDAA